MTRSGLRTRRERSRRDDETGKWNQEGKIAMRRAAPWVAGLAALACTVAEAQQVVEVDFEAGRTIIDDEWRSMFHHDLAVDWARNILYVRDDEEPEGIMAFSLETGEWIRTIPTPTGDGPQELTHGFRDVAIARGGGVYVSGLLRVIEFDALGVFVRSWTPEAPTREGVCDFAGSPAVPTQGGVVRRGSDGDESVGPVLANGRALKAATVDDGVSISRRLMSSRIACSEDVAYVVSSYDTGPDSVFTYRRGDEEGRIAVPTDFIEEDCVRAATVNGVTLRRECPVWSERLRPSFDDLGNLVLFGNDKTVQGAIINPETGCYAMVRTPSNRIHRVARIHADSALVFRPDTGREYIEGLGEMEVTYGNSATGLMMSPLRRVSGEPCSGMLSSVG